jgi:hypothetical protein
VRASGGSLAEFLFGMEAARHSRSCLTSVIESACEAEGKEVMPRRFQLPDPHSWLTVAKIASAHLVKDTTVIRWIYAGLKTPEGMLVRLQATKFGNRWKIKKTDLEGFLELMRPLPPVEAGSRRTG